MTKAVLVIAGASGVGKTSIASEILSGNDSFGFVRSLTTRAKRGDGHDDEYIYLTVDEFRARISTGGMLEYTEYGGNLYGTPASEIERIFSEGKTPLMILDINGAVTLKSVKRDFYPFAVYVTSDIETLDKRLYERAENDGFSEKAMAVYERRKAQNRSDLVFVNDNPSIFDLVIENVEVSATAEGIALAFKTKS